MKPRKNYLNCTLANVPYLLPYGQSIVDFAAGMRINDSGTRLWNAIQQGADRDALLALMREDCDAPDDRLSDMEQDLDEFLAELSHHGAILPGDPTSPYGEHTAQLGPLVLSLRVPDALWEQYFSGFACQSDHPDIHQRIQIYLRTPASHANGTILVRSAELIIAETDDSYLFFPLASPVLKEMHVTKDGSLAELYCSAPTEHEMEELFHAIRFAFLIAAAQHELYAVHSASILYRERAWLFSGPSGAGKSTHTQLWKDTFDTPVLNGDLNLLGIENGIPMCYGLPWNGTSGICTVGSWPLGGITFLKKALSDEVAYPTPDQKILYLVQRLISPSWTAEQLAQNLAFCERLTARASIFRLFCTRETHAAEVMRNAIDQDLNAR